MAIATRIHGPLCGVVLLVLAAPPRADATLVSSKKEECPVCRNEVYLDRVESFGSYILEEPSKYDLIYPPASYESFIATCGNCGYSQIASDFLSLSPSQIEKLKSTRLMAAWRPTSREIPFPDRLERAIQVNQELDRGKEFWAFFNRIRIYHLRELDPQRAAEVARQELDLVQYDRRLWGKERLYLLGEYSRLAGDPTAAGNYLRRAADTSIHRELTLPLLITNGVCVLLGVFLAWRYKRRFSSCLVAGMVAATLVLSTLVFIGPLRRHIEHVDQILDQIIADRTELLDQTDKTGGETEPNQPGPSDVE